MLKVVWTTSKFLIKWYSSSTNLKSFEHFWICRFFRSGFHGSLLMKSPFHNRSERFGFSDLEVFWDDLPVSRLDFLESSGKVVWTSCKVVWTSCKVVWTFWKPSGLPGSLLTKFSSISSGVQSCLCRGMIYNSFGRRGRLQSKYSRLLKYKSSGQRRDDLQFSRPSDDLLVSRLLPDDFPCKSSDAQIWKKIRFNTLNW
ncbi:hypothetical protein IGI04_002352 [Brassica rapa subsp. trilocularis]|uniref:Uncharacterized protein n=1 Tax=Brassica rapa subsp. trilocularis TaxID=1813537 RepID=A0ABQ7NVC4_BRACM|nr:hypothetical protein IGI04_002352 [Brassica rapa subsp. trilocularis]